MTLRELLQGVPYRQATADLSAEITQVSFDSRNCGPGTAFVAVRRETADGHDYIPDAVGRGASVIVSRVPVPGAPNIVTEDTELALSLMAANFYGNPARGLTLIGVTGTKGKTSTAFYLKTLLERAGGYKTGLMGTIRNMAGDEVLSLAANTTPESTQFHELLAQMRARGCSHVVLEVSSHALALGRVGGLRFTAGIFTNLSQDHLNFHKTMEDYLAAKAKLFAVSDIAVINGDDPAAAFIRAAAGGRIFTYSAQDDAADLTARNIRLKDAGGVEFEALMTGAIRRVRLPIPGGFTVYNALAALSCAVALGVELDAAVDALETVEGVPGRMEPVAVNARFRVLVDYAHTPDSVEQVTQTVRDATPGRVISVLGCGGNRDKTKRPKMAAAAARHSDVVILTTDNPRFEEPENILADMLPGLADAACAHEIVVDRRAAIRRALSLARDGDTVLIMGKGHEYYQEVRGVRSHFDDREEAAAWFESR